VSPEGLIKLIGLGASISVAERNDASNITTRLHQAELVAQGYISLDRTPWFLRPGFRLGFEYIPYPDDPKALSIDEKTWSGTFELGILYEGFLIPSLSWQSSLVMRNLGLTTSSSIAPDSSALPATEWLNSQALAWGLGIPVASGQLLIEPFYRLTWIEGDERRTGQWGMDATWALGWAEKSPGNIPK